MAEVIVLRVLFCEIIERKILQIFAIRGSFDIIVALKGLVA
jgi:hypothetical protein